MSFLKGLKEKAIVYGGGTVIAALIAIPVHYFDKSLALKYAGKEFERVCAQHETVSPERSAEYVKLATAEFAAKRYGWFSPVLYSTYKNASKLSEISVNLDRQLAAEHGNEN